MVTNWANTQKHSYYFKVQNEWKKEVLFPSFRIESVRDKDIHTTTTFLLMIQVNAFQCAWIHQCIWSFIPVFFCRNRIKLTAATDAGAIAFCYLSVFYLHIALLLAVDGKKQESCTDKNDENFSPFPFNQFSLFCEKFLLIFIISLCPSRALLFLHPCSIPLCARYFLCLPIYIFDHFCLEELKVYPRWCTINILCSFFGVCLWFCMHTKCISGLLLLKISPWIHRERMCICAALCTFSRNNCHKQQQLSKKCFTHFSFHHLLLYF